MLYYEICLTLVNILMKIKYSIIKNWPDHLYRILIIGGSESGKRNVLLNLISNLPDIDKLYLYSKDP